MAGTELVVGVSSDSNNSARKLFSALGCLITFCGGGAGFGQALGFTACPAIPQPDAAITQLSNNSSRDGLGRSSIFFMLGSDGGQGFSLLVFGGTGLVNLLNLGGTGSGLLPGFRALGTVTTPRPAGAQHGRRPSNEHQ